MTVVELINSYLYKLVPVSNNAFKLARKDCFEEAGKNLAYCAKCGAKLKEDDRFCYACGAAVAKVVTEEYTVSSDNLIDRVRELLHEGNVTRVIVKDEKGKALLEIPATIGVIGVVLAPWLAALGVIAALATNCRIVVERRE
jgi:hypothetical protein